MKKLLAAIAMAGLIAHVHAQSEPAATPPAPASASTSGGAIVIPGAHAATAAGEGNLTPLYVGASVVGVAVIAGALNSGGNPHDGTSGTGGTTGTTGTH
jgi:hypothetical protein